MNKEVLLIIGTILTAALGWGGIVIKHHLERKNDKKYSRQMLDRIKGLENQQDILKEMIKDVIKNIEFEHEFSNIIAGRAAQIVNANVSIGQEYKDLLMEAANQFKEIGLLFHNSDLRGNKYKMSELIEAELHTRLWSIENTMNHISPEDKVYSFGTGNEEDVNFISLFKKSKAHKKIELLTLKLKKNGLDNESLIALFEEFINEFLKELAIFILEWEGLKKKI